MRFRDESARQLAKTARDWPRLLIIAVETSAQLTKFNLETRTTMIATFIAFMLLASTAFAEHSPNLRSRNLADASNGPCGGTNPICTELYETGSRYQAYTDGFCYKFNQCTGYTTSQCVCRSDSYTRPAKNYVFEHAGRGTIQAFNPYNRPTNSLEKFDSGEHQTQVNTIVDGHEDDSPELTKYTVAMEDEAFRGNLEISTGVTIETEHRLTTHLAIHFRVLRSGTYKITAAFANDSNNSNGCRVDIDDRDYHPNQSSSDKSILRWTSSSDREQETTFQMEPGHTYGLLVSAYISGEEGTAISWHIEHQD